MGSAFIFFMITQTCTYLYPSNWSSHRYTVWISQQILIGNWFHTTLHRL